MAPTFSPHLALQIDKSSQMLSIRGRAPIVVSELDLEFDLAQQRDDLEELNDFTSLLIPAARKSAARRLGALKSPMARRVQEGLKQRHSQRNSVPAANKFPVIDEDLLMLATQRVPVDGCSAIPPPNLCRLITNVSEARWTSKRPLGHSPKANLERERKERPKSVGHLPIPRGANNGQPHKEQQQNMLRKKRLELSRVNKCQNNGTANGVKRNDEAALRRMSALSVVSSYTTNMEEAANCDCTSLALAAFRSNWVAGMRRKKWQQAKQRPRGEGDDAYRKMSPPPTAMRDSSTNDSGISSSSCSSESSRSASLADAFHHQCHLLNLPTQTSGPNCLRCSAKMNLPPKSLADEKKGTTHQSLQGRRRHWLALLLGNMLRMMDKEKPGEVRERRQYDKVTTGEDTKMTKESNATEPSRNGKLNVPQINVQMVEEEGEERAKVNKKCQKINDGGGEETFIGWH